MHKFYVTFQGMNDILRKKIAYETDINPIECATSENSGIKALSSDHRKIYRLGGT